jgi:AraC-like DNA-binding protein
MVSRLGLILDWETRALTAMYRVRVLAKMSGVSVSQLDRFFAVNTGLSPFHWMNRVRQLRAPALLHQGWSVKQVAYELGYRQSSHFSQEFKRFHGITPSGIRLAGQNSPMRNLDR